MTNDSDALIVQLQKEIENDLREVGMSTLRDRVTHSVKTNSESAYTNLIVAGLFLTGILYMCVYLFTDL